MQPVLATIERVTPELLAHLKECNDDLEMIPPPVVEQLVAELLAGNGWHHVEVVARNAETSADILAVRRDALGIETTYFVEVKRWKDKVGIEVINQVVGAMELEQTRFGWNMGLVVTVAGAKRFRKITPEELRLKHVHVREKRHIVSLLGTYRPTPSGLWLPD